MELGAVGRALCLLEVLSKVRSSNLETLSKQTGLPKATALRMLSALVEHGYVSRDASDRYSLTLKMFTVGARALANVDLLEVAGPVAGQLRDLTGETVHIGILEENRAVYVLKKESNYTIRMNSRVGKSIPLHCSAIGKCLLASLDDAAVEAYIAGEGLKGYTPNTITDAGAFRREIAKVRDQGYAFDDEEHEQGIFCVAAPIRNTYGETVAAMSVSTPVFRLDKAAVDGLVSKVCASCSEVSTILGYMENKQEKMNMSNYIEQQFSLKGNLAWVTGGVYGIGFAIASAFAKAGCSIAVNCTNPEHLEKGLEDYRKAGITDVRGYISDVTKEEEVKATVAAIEKDFGRKIDILVNNAGIIRRIPMTEMSVEEFRKVIDIDLNAPFICSKAVIPGMIEMGHGKIINVCSMMSELGRETVSAYAAAKGGLKMLTRNICSEYGEHNIQCNGIGPGYIATPQTAPLRERRPDGSRHPFDQFIVAKTPAARWGTPEDLEGPALFLASKASDFVNGHILYVDGGILAYIGKQPK